MDSPSSENWLQRRPGAPPPPPGSRGRANSIALGFAASGTQDPVLGTSWNNNRPSRSYFHGSTYQDSPGNTGPGFSSSGVGATTVSSVREETASLAELALEDNLTGFMTGSVGLGGDGAFSSQASDGSIEAPASYRRRSISRNSLSMLSGFRSGSLHSVAEMPRRSSPGISNNNSTSNFFNHSSFEAVPGAGGAIAASYGGHALAKWNLSASPERESLGEPVLPAAAETQSSLDNNNSKNLRASLSPSSIQQPPTSLHVTSGPNKPENNNSDVLPPPLHRNTSYLSTILKGKSTQASVGPVAETPTGDGSPSTTGDSLISTSAIGVSKRPIASSPVTEATSTISTALNTDATVGLPSGGAPSSPSYVSSTSPMTYSTPARTFRVKQQKSAKAATQSTTTNKPQAALTSAASTTIASDLTNPNTLTSLPSFPSPSSPPAQQTSPLLPGCVSKTGSGGHDASSSDHLGYQTFHNGGGNSANPNSFNGTTGTNYGRQFLYSAMRPSSWAKCASEWASEHLTRDSVIENGVKKPLSYLPSVILGVLLNVLDGLSYGMILFPLNNPIFATLGPAGLSMFYVSCVISQLVYSLGGSKFGSGVGSEMIEVVPFFHTMATTLVQEIGDDKPHAVVATTITAFALSSVVTGLVFFSLGYARLGSIIGFFPRHILVGCIGGVGWFLVVTGLEVSSRLDGSFEYSWAMLKWLFMDDNFIKWAIPLALALILVMIQKYTHHPLLVPSYFISVFVIFHLAVLLVPHLSYEHLRKTGWLFQGPENSDEPWWYFYTLYDFKAIDYIALLKTIPAMFALTFFGILHVPINIPALAASIGEDNIDVDRELLAHGISNALSGLCGSIQNYLVYTNSVLFIRSGADSRLAGVMLAIATFLIMIAGPVVIGFIPVMVVGALIFLLGIELINEALIDTYGRVSRFEYLTIVIIVVTMGAWDFVAGIIVGILLACASFTIQASQTSAIKATFTGAVARSTVRRNAALQSFLFEVGDQIFVLKLTGNIFFGTIVRIEQAVRNLLDDEYFYQQPIRYLILDMEAVTGLDFSAAEAFARMKRLLDTKSVYMIISSPDETHMIQALHAVGLLERTYTEEVLHNKPITNHVSDEESLIDSTHQFQQEEENEATSMRVRLFPNLNSSLEWCENQFLKDYYIRRDHLRTRQLGRPSTSSSANMSSFGGVIGDKKSIEIPENDVNSKAALNVAQRSVSRSDSIKAQDSMSIVGSPRVAFLQLVADKTLREDPQVLVSASKWQHYKQPLPLLLQTFQGVTTKRESFWHRVSPYFVREQVKAGTILYESDSEATGFYIVESGVLRADYDTIEQGSLYEIILAGTTCGELPFFSGTYRTATVSAETDAVVWKLDRKSWQALRELKPDGAEIATEFYLIALKLTVERFESVTAFTLLSSR